MRNGAEVEVEVEDDAEAEDEQLDKEEEFERAYNFRFEEPVAKGGESTGIVTYARTTQHSLRRKDDKRKKQREQRKNEMEDCSGRPQD